MATASRRAKAAPPWLELPREITVAILRRVGAIEILKTAEKVCTAWRSVCRDPAMWQSIYIQYTADLWETPHDTEKLCLLAVDRSQGQLIDINMEYFVSDDLLLYISQRSSQLRRLKLAFAYGITAKGLTEAVKNLPQLEELHVSYAYIDAKAIEAIGRSCPHLKSLELNTHWYLQNKVCDMDARAIAENMPELRHLHLVGNKMTNEGLQAILDGCPHLKTLDLRQCFNLHFGGDLAKLCSQRIEHLRRPYDPTDDYRFHFRFHGS